MARVCADGNAPHKLEPLHGQTVGNLGRMRTCVIQRNLAKGPKRDIQKYPLIFMYHMTPGTQGFLLGKQARDVFCKRKSHRAVLS